MLTDHKVFSIWNTRYSVYLIIFICVFFSSIHIYAQSSNAGIVFQALAKDNNSNPARDRTIYIQSSILQFSASGSSVLTEEFQTLTDGNGVFTISVGLGKTVTSMVVVEKQIPS